jgi:hypothetical protein
MPPPLHITSGAPGHEATEVSRRTSSSIRSSTGDIANTNIITWPVSPVLQKRVSINETSSESSVTTKTEVRVKVCF